MLIDLLTFLQIQFDIFQLFIEIFISVLYLSAAEVVNDSDSPNYWDSPQPYFDNSSNRDIIATVGQSAIMKCSVRNLGDRAVSYYIRFSYKVTYYTL